MNREFPPDYDFQEEKREQWAESLLVDETHRKKAGTWSIVITDNDEYNFEVQISDIGAETNVMILSELAEADENVNAPAKKVYMDIKVCLFRRGRLRHDFQERIAEWISGISGIPERYRREELIAHVLIAPRKQKSRLTTILAAEHARGFQAGIDAAIEAATNIKTK